MSCTCYCVQCLKRFEGRNRAHEFCSKECYTAFKSAEAEHTRKEREAKRDQCARTIGGPFHYVRGGRQSVDCGLNEEL